MSQLSLYILKKPNKLLNTTSNGSKKTYFCLMKTVIRVIFWFSVFLSNYPFCGISQTRLEAPQLSIQTQSYFHNPDTGTYLYRNAKVEWEGVTVESTEINFHPGKNRLTASGYVRVTEGSIVAVMDELEINVKNGNGIFRNAIIFDSSNKAYMSAKEVRRLGKNHFVAQTCTFTTCDPKTPAWQITGSEVNYYSQNFSSSQRTFLKIGNVPIFYFPYLAWPTVKSRQSGFLSPEYIIVRSSLRKWDLGYRIGIPYFWAINPEQDLTITYDWVERRGPGLRLDYQYALTRGMRGQIKYQEFFERDAREPENESGSLRAEDIDSSELNPKRFKFEFNHNQQIDGQSRLIASALAYSDSQFQKEYELIENPDPNTAQKLSASINRQFSNGSISLSATQTRLFSELALLNRNIDLTQVQHLPALSFQFRDTFWRSGRASLSPEISGSVVRYYRVQGYNGEGVTANPRLNFNFPFFDHFDGSIKIGKQLSHYKVRDPNISGSEDEYGFEILDSEIEFNTVFSRMFKNETGTFTRFKHLLTPRIQYNYIEDVRQESNSGVPFGGGVSVRRLATIRLENILLAKRRYFERSIKLTSLALDKMRRDQIDPALIRKLELIKDQEFPSIQKFERQLDNLFGKELIPEQKAKIISYLEKGVIPLQNKENRGQFREGKSSSIANLNFIQHYDYLKKNRYFQPIGPAVKGNETEPGHALLPLRTILKVTPGTNFSFSIFNRYHHQKSRVIEYSADVSVGLSKHNKASVHFRNNEEAYQTPFGEDIAAANTFSFSNNFTTSDKLAFGVAGTVNLDADNYTFRRRLTSSVFSMEYKPDCWNIRLSLSENVDKTTTSSGREKEYIDRTLYAYINLGGVEIPEQILPNLE